MTTSTSPAQEQLHKTVHELLTVLQGAQSAAQIAATADNVRSLGLQVAALYERHVDVHWKELDQGSFEREWTSLTWPLIGILSRLSVRPDDFHNLQLRLNTILVNLVNNSRQSSPPTGMSSDDYRWTKFWECYGDTLNVLHELYSQLDAPGCDLELRLLDFCHNGLLIFLQSFREFTNNYSTNVLPQLRMAQVERMSKNRQMDDRPVKLASAFYCNILYTLGVVAARLQGFRWESLQSKYRFSNVDPVKPLTEMVINTMEQLVCDCLFGTKPSTNAILVTNNLFPFNCACLPPALIFQQFDVQIVSEETALAIQNELREVKQGQRSASNTNNFPSAALVAMKPTSGVKRNNATANAEGGGNTAHKKSDVNSRESVTIIPSWNDKYGGWQAHYPHLLCTTRQKDTVLLDTRSGQMGKRPLFYFYIRGTMFSPSGRTSHVRTLSLPFTIATRRNQDCQVQRMMSSYTATCFWLYGLQSLDGLILNWCDTGIEWESFVELYRSYFTVNAEVQRTLSDDDFRLMEDKLTCDDCREFKEEGRRLVTFKNVLCPHLRYDVEQNQLRFSIWRGLLEVLQIYQDPRTNVKTLWNDHILMGFSDIEEVNGLLEPHPSAMCLRISHVIGGSICIAMRPGTSAVVHLEPIDLKKLQAKSVFEYLSDIASSAKIEYVLTANRELVLVSELVRKYGIGADHGKVRTITTNITHGGSIEKMTKMRFTPLRIAVVTSPPEASPPPPILPPTSMYQTRNGSDMISPRPSFESQLTALMKSHGKSTTDVVAALGFGDLPPQPMTWGIDQTMFMPAEYGWVQQTPSMIQDSTPFV